MASGPTIVGEGRVRWITGWAVGAVAGPRLGLGLARARLGSEGEISGYPRNETYTIGRPLQRIGSARPPQRWSAYPRDVRPAVAGLGRGHHLPLPTDVTRAPSRPDPRRGATTIDYDTFTDQTVSEAVDLTNLFADGDLVSGDDLRRLLHLYVLVDDPVDVAAFADLAVRMRAVFEAEVALDRVSMLNDLLTAHEPRPFIAEHDGQAPHFHYVSDDRTDVRRVGASLAMALAHVVVDDGAERLGSCAAAGCRNVFVDRTRNRSQRFCSKTCATRVHVAAHRARR